MNASFKTTTGIATFLLAGIATMVAVPATAVGQVNNSAGFGVGPFIPLYPPSYYENSATAAESFLRGTADVVRADGERALNASRAMQNWAEAESRMLDNRVKYLEHRLQRRRIGTAEREADFVQLQSRRDMQMALNEADRLLENSDAYQNPDETRAAARLRLAKSILEGDHVQVTAASDIAFDQ